MAGHALHVVVDTRRGFARRLEDDGSFRFVRGPELLDLLPIQDVRVVRDEPPAVVVVLGRPLRHPCLRERLLVDCLR